MLIVFFKSVITFFVVFFVVRLMGKREVGEMQPFELVITLIIAEVACIPMNDQSIPFYAGVIPIITLAFLQILFSFLSRKFLPVRKLASGTSVIVVDKEGVNYANLAKLNMNVNDLISSIRCAGCMDISKVKYAIIETSGKVSILQKNEQEQVQYLPLPLILNGAWEEENVKLSGVEKVNILQEAKAGGNLEIDDVIYCDIRGDGTVFFSSDKCTDFTATVKISGGENW